MVGSGQILVAAQSADVRRTVGPTFRRHSPMFAVPQVCTPQDWGIEVTHEASGEVVDDGSLRHRRTMCNGGVMTTETPPAPTVVDTPFDELSATIPASSRFLRVVRLMAASAAAIADFDVEEIEDLRIVVDELCSAAMERAVGPIDIQMQLRAGECVYLATAPCEAGAAALDSMRSTIVGALTDSYHFAVTDDLIRFGFTKTCSSDR